MILRFWKFDPGFVLRVKKEILALKNEETNFILLKSFKRQRAGSWLAEAIRDKNPHGIIAEMA